MDNEKDKIVKLQLEEKEVSQSYFDNYSGVIDFNKLAEDESDPELINVRDNLSEDAPSREAIQVSEEPDVGIEFPLLTETHPPGGIPAQCENELWLPYIWYKKLRCLFLLSGNWIIQSGVVRGYLGLYHERFLHILSFPYTIHPFSDFYFAWELLTTLVLAVSMAYEPFMLTFNCLDFVNEVNRKISLTISLILLADVWLTFYVGKPDPSTLVVTLDPTITRVLYLRRQFLFDVITRFPSDTIMIACLSSEKLKVKQELAWIRLVGFMLKILRIQKLYKFIKRLEKSLQIGVWTIKLGTHLIILLYCIHWGACLSWLLPDIMNAHLDEPKKMSWITNLDLWEEEIHVQYLNSFLRSLSNLFTLDGGDFAPQEYEEILCTATLIIIAQSIVAYFISTLSQMITAIGKDNVYQEMVGCVEQYMRFRRIPGWLHQRVLAYYDKKYKGHWFPEGKIMESVSANLRAEILSHNCKRLVEKVYIFSGIPTAVMLNLVQRLDYEVCVPGDILLSPNVNTNCIYFIEDGFFRVLDKYGSCLEVLGHGDFFGEVALLCPEATRSSTVIATTFAEVYKLTKKSYLQTMQQFPEVHKKMVQVATERIKYEFGGFGDKQQKRKADGRREWRKIVQAGSKPIEEYYADVDAGETPEHVVAPETMQFIYHQYYTAGQ